LGAIIAPETNIVANNKWSRTLPSTVNSQDWFSVDFIYHLSSTQDPINIGREGTEHHLRIGHNADRSKIEVYNGSTRQMEYVIGYAVKPIYLHNKIAPGDTDLIDGVPFFRPMIRK
jgi:hypothetical protein